MGLIYRLKSYRIFVFLLLMLFTINLFSQEGANDWKLYKNIDGVEINYRYQECNNPNQGTFKEYVLFQYNNTNDYSVDIDYYIEFWYGNKKRSTNDNISEEYHKRVSLKPKQVIETSCRFLRELNVFSKFLNYYEEELTKFELVKINVAQTRQTKQLGMPIK